MDTKQLTGFSPLVTSSRLLVTWDITDHTRLRMRQGSAGFLLAHLALAFDRRVEDIDFNYRNGELDDWGHAFRAVRGYSEYSRHAYGLAIDLNATEHPLGIGAEKNFTPQQIATIRRRLKMYEGCIRWGGDYSGRKDPMHFEIDRPLRDCERVAKKCMKNKIGKEILRLNPEQRKVILS